MSRGLKVRSLRRAEADAALAHLAADPLHDLLLADAVRRLGAVPSPGEVRSRVIGAFSEEQLVGLASLQPSVALSSAADTEAREALLPHLTGVAAGLIKCEEQRAEQIWRCLRAMGRRALLDRFEIAYAVRPEEVRLCDPLPGTSARPATPQDLEALVQAARESLREERRPDPFEGDAEGFRRWVAGRVGRARVIDRDGVPVFVGYADVRCEQGWLLQGVYTWPSWRRRGLAAAGVSALCRAAFAEGAQHVQLAVVEGNAAAERLYLSLGFHRFARLRTILFA